MKERPILFSAPMVRAILNGKKCQTRRLVKPQPRTRADVGHFGAGMPFIRAASKPVRCPYGQRGDRLWVREAHSIHHAHGQHRGGDKRWGPWGGLPTRISPEGTQIAYFREGFDRCDGGRWRPSIHMPRWASRITLEVTGVRVERLHDITSADIMNEGVQIPVDVAGKPLIDFSTKYGPAHFLGDNWLSPQTNFDTLLRAHWAALWVSIHGMEFWTANPWVWVVEFKRVTA